MYKLRINIVEIADYFLYLTRKWGLVIQLYHSAKCI